MNSNWHWQLLVVAVAIIMGEGSQYTPHFCLVANSGSQPSGSNGVDVQHWCQCWAVVVVAAAAVTSKARALVPILQPNSHLLCDASAKLHTCAFPPPPPDGPDHW